ncbi:CIC11C00000005012 [Sungouiella intermedia]|uniref:CIC11C00000005012 n=1 Tax=Sungouiella intermedia TaxID=45354 RepID=A0A1L0DJ47_9ASCO|nr:CIC11C00000005012 [[Candida] intermedia]
MDSRIASSHNSYDPSIASENNSVVEFSPQLIPQEELPAPGPTDSYFPFSHIIDITLSEPRDVLQSERTYLSFIRFSVSLYFTAIGMILGFRLLSSDGPTHGTHPGFNKTLFNHIIAYLLIFLSFATLLVCAINYFKTVRRYSQRRIHTYAASNTIIIACVTAIVVALIAINISMIVERYKQDQ